MHAKITAYKGMLVCELVADKSIDDEVVTTLDNPSTFGQVIMNTEKNLGVSKEALELMKTVKIGHDDLGDIDWFSSVKGDTFGWIGGPYNIVNPANAETARGFKILAHILIENEVPEGAMKAIDAGAGQDEDEDE